MKAVSTAALLLLAACHSGRSVTAENASVAEVNAKVTAAGGQEVFLSPGHWESTVTIHKMEVPGLPPQVAAKLQGAMGKAQVSASCLTPEQAKRPAASFFSGNDNKQCRYDHFAMGKGAIDAKLTCKGEENGGTTMAFTGAYTADTFHLALTTQAHGAPGQPMGAMNMAATMDAKRTGACTGKEDQ